MYIYYNFQVRLSFSAGTGAVAKQKTVVIGSFLGV
jgi:hypothetical protein